MNASNLLLGTHAWVWFMLGDKHLKNQYIQLIEKAINDSTIYLAGISLWEIAMLVRKKRIQLPQPCLEWLEQAMLSTQPEILPVTTSIAVESTQLPDGFHGDPSDRLIVATCRIHQLNLMKADKKICDYAKKGHLRVCQI